jgi:hypothetical protein
VPLRAPKRPAKPKRAKAERKPTEPLQDEWGIYDPAVCGFDALFAKLDGEEAGPTDEEPTAGEMLVKANGSGTTPAASAPARTPRLRPAPLAMWARKDGSVVKPSTAAPGNGETDGSRASDVRLLLRGLNLPPWVAEVGWTGACRIDRVRVKARPKRRRRGGRKAPVVILSRRVLERLRPLTVKRLKLGPVAA